MSHVGLGCPIQLSRHRAFGREEVVLGDRLSAAVAGVAGIPDLPDLSDLPDGCVWCFFQLFPLHFFRPLELSCSCSFPSFLYVLSCLFSHRAVQEKHRRESLMWAAIIVGEGKHHNTGSPILPLKINRARSRRTWKCSGYIGCNLFLAFSLLDLFSGTGHPEECN